jgi:hypothetical protein
MFWMLSEDQGGLNVYPGSTAFDYVIGPMSNLSSITPSEQQWPEIWGGSP